MYFLRKCSEIKNISDLEVNRETHIRNVESISSGNLSSYSNWEHSTDYDGFDPDEYSDFGSLTKKVIETYQHFFDLFTSDGLMEKNTNEKVLKPIQFKTLVTLIAHASNLIPIVDTKNKSIAECYIAENTYKKTEPNLLKVANALKYNKKREQNEQTYVVYCRDKHSCKLFTHRFG